MSDDDNQGNESALEKLVDVVEHIDKKYEVVESEIRTCTDYRFGDESNIYSRMHAEVNDLLKDFEFNETDLVNFVHARANGKGTLREGMYTGILLELLTERNDGKLRLHLDGDGQEFNNLFYHARNVDEVIVEKFKGDNICSRIGIDKGKAGLVMIMNCEGDSIAEEVASHNSEIEKLILLNNEGYGVGFGAGNEEGYIRSAIIVGNNSEEALKQEAPGKTDFLIAVDNIGDGLIQGIGSNYDCEAGLIVAAYNNSSLMATHCGGWYGKAGQIFLFKNLGHGTGDGIAFNAGKCNYVLIADCQGNGIGSKIGSYEVDPDEDIDEKELEGEVGTLVLIGNIGKNEAEDVIADEIVRPDKELGEYLRETNQYEIMDMALSSRIMTIMDYESALARADEIIGMYEQVKLRLEK